MMRKGLNIFLIMLFMSSSVFAVPKWLQNDGYYDGASSTVEAGFITNEIMASVFVPNTGDYPAKLLKVQFLLKKWWWFNETGQFTLQIWEDAGSINPGQLLFQQTYTLTGSNNLQTIDLSSQNLVINSGNFRVGWKYLQDMSPAFCSDLDGTITPLRNLIYGDTGSGSWQWHWADVVGVHGDWIHRIQIDTNFATATATPTSTPTHTPTPEPTDTPEPTETPEPTITPTPTPIPPIPTTGPIGAALLLTVIGFLMLMSIIRGKRSA